MFKKLLPIFLILLGSGTGIGAGLVLKPEQQEPEHKEITGTDSCEETLLETPEGTLKDNESSDREYVKLNNQFVVPVVRDERVSALVVLSLSVEVNQGEREMVFAREPKLRDAFLRTLFDHANMGGFNGAFTNARNMEALRRSLNETATSTLGNAITDVLIVDIARQDA